MLRKLMRLRQKSGFLRRSLNTNRNTPSEVTAAKQNENNKNEALQNEIEILNKEVESMKTGQPVVSQIPIRWQLLLYPPSRLTPHKTTVENIQKT